MYVPDSPIVFQPSYFPDFYEEGLNDRKILILGESHYHRCENDLSCRDEKDETAKNALHRKLTINAVSWWKENPHRSPLSYRLPELFHQSKEDFWARVVFYNYVQAYVTKARERPSVELWADPINAINFQTVINHFEPDRILVLGKKLWKNLPSETPPLFKNPSKEERLRVSNDVRSYTEDEKNCYWYYSRKGHRSLAMPIMHPSAPQFFLDEWVKPVSEWLAFDR